MLLILNMVHVYSLEKGLYTREIHLLHLISFSMLNRTSNVVLCVAHLVYQYHRLECN